MKILIVDDDEVFAARLTEILISKIEKAAVVSKSILKEEYDFDIYFLDIDMPEENGIDSAARIREHNNDAKIIFISYREDLVFQALQTFPFYFVRKKYLDEELSFVLKKIEKEFEEITITVKANRNDIKINTKEILYLEKAGQYINIVTIKCIYTVKGSLQSIYLKLPEDEFGLVSQSFVCGFRYVKAETKDYLEMNNGALLYYSRGKRKEFLKKFLKYKAREK